MVMNPNIAMWMFNKINQVFILTKWYFLIFKFKLYVLKYQ